MAEFEIRGKNLEVTPALREYVEKRVGKIARYFERMNEITVLLSTAKGRHIVEVTAPVGGGVILRGEEATMDMYTSIDLVVEKLERQIRKHKTKLQKRFRGGGFKAEMLAEAPAMSALQPAPAGEDDAQEFVVVKRKRFNYKPLDVQEAIMQMNLLGHDFFVFRNAETEEINVVYRRGDGNFGLIEPK